MKRGKFVVPHTYKKKRHRGVPFLFYKENEPNYLATVKRSVTLPFSVVITAL